MKWADYFEYRDGKLFWKVDRGSNKVKGKLAGFLDNDGYTRVRLNSKTYSQHLVIWEMFNGKVPEGFEIDHKNRIRTDNKIGNLRLATRAQNKVNTGLSSKNKTGYRGVYLCKLTSKYRTQLTFNKAKLHLGTYNTPEEASLVYEAKAKELRGEFYETIS